MHRCIQSFFYPIEEVPIPLLVLLPVMPWVLQAKLQLSLFPDRQEQLRRQD